MLRLNQIRPTDATSADCLEPTVGNVGCLASFSRCTKRSRRPDRILTVEKLRRQPLVDNQAIDRDQAVFTIQTIDQMLAERRWPQCVFGSSICDLRCDCARAVLVEVCTR
jgi:hypothetical protein